MFVCIILQCVCPFFKTTLILFISLLHSLVIHLSYFVLSQNTLRLYVSQIQDEFNSQTYYWDGDSVVTFKKPFENIWRVFVVFKPNAQMLEQSSSSKKNKSKDKESSKIRKGEIAAKEFEFGKGDWVDLGICGLPPRPPATGGGPTTPTKVNDLEEKRKPAPSMSMGRSPSIRERISIFTGRGGSLPRPGTEKAETEELMVKVDDKGGDDEEEDEGRVNIRGMGKRSPSKTNKLRNSISSPRH